MAGNCETLLFEDDNFPSTLILKFAKPTKSLQINESVLLNFESPGVSILLFQIFRTARYDDGCDDGRSHE